MGKKPLIVLNFKTYGESMGEKAVLMAKYCEEVSLGSGVQIIACPRPRTYSGLPGRSKYLCSRSTSTALVPEVIQVISLPSASVHRGQVEHLSTIRNGESCYLKLMPQFNLRKKQDWLPLSARIILQLHQQRPRFPRILSRSSRLNL